MIFLNRIIKQVVKPPILVGGIGRCGTTLVYKAIRSNLFYRGAKKFVVDIPSRDFKPWRVYKTHDYAPDFIDPRVKVIFMFGNPMDAVVSAHKILGGPMHYKHVKSPLHSEHDQIFTKDVMLKESHFDSWMKQQSFDFLSLRYEHLYRPEVRNIVEQFLEIKLNLPEHRQRSSSWKSHSEHEALATTYASLNKKVEEAESVKVWAAL